MQRFVFSLVCVFWIGMADAQNYQLTATYGEEILESGFLPDPYTVEITAGGKIPVEELGSSCAGKIANAPDFELDYSAADLSLYLSVSADEDTSLVVNTPDGDWICDDDSGEGLNPLLEINNPASGVYDIWVGAVGDAEPAQATLAISELSGGSTNTSSISEIPLNGRYMEELEVGRLDRSDDRRDNNAWQDSYFFTWAENQKLLIDLRSEDFDTYLTLISPDGESFINDDFQELTNRSLLYLTLSDGGEYEMQVSSYEEGSVGTYVFGIDTDNVDESAVNQSVRGDLNRQDNMREGDQYTDAYEFTGVPGQTIVIDLKSTEFDTFLTLESPSGIVQENDDEGSTEHSMIVVELAEYGTYQVQVSSYGGGETGDYSFTIEGELSNQAPPEPIAIELGAVVTGSLVAGNDALRGGHYRDYYSVQVDENTYLQIDLASEEFDTLLTLLRPDGIELENDDFDGSTERSRIEELVTQSGEYQIVVSSYQERETGSYELRVNSSDKPFSATKLLGDNNVYGIFVGVSDYSELRQSGDGWADLDFTAEDATVAYDTLISSAGMSADNAITLIDEEATIDNVIGAFEEMAGKIGPNDVFVFFFSGHGGQESRVDGPNAADADGYDETLAFSDATMVDDDFAELFDQIRAGTSLIILDSCYSGGFAKDVISKPGRMGLFSSEEDVPSLVATNFRAGGYLSHFFSEAFDQGEADSDDDGAISAMELSQYLFQRYNFSSNSKVSSSADADLGNQHLVADRGGVSHDSILFTLDDK